MTIPPFCTRHSVRIRRWLAREAPAILSAIVLGAAWTVVATVIGAVCWTVVMFAIFPWAGPFGTVLALPMLAAATGLAVGRLAYRPRLNAAIAQSERR